MKYELTSDGLRGKLEYNEDTGIFTNIKSGAVVGSIMPKGYCVVSCMGGSYLSHRLAWLYVYGSWPVNQIDHINGIRNDNRISNLRDVPAYVNYQNQRKARSNNLSCGLLGVTWDKARGKWKAGIMQANGKNKGLGRYDSQDIAHAAYLSAKRLMHEGCTI